MLKNQDKNEYEIAFLHNINHVMYARAGIHLWNVLVFLDCNVCIYSVWASLELYGFSKLLIHMACIT
jgi:hypothetical protein